MKKIFLIIVSLTLLIGIVYILKGKGSNDRVLSSQNQNIAPFSSIPSANSQENAPSSNVTIKDGIQYITIDVKHGYSPRSTTAKGGIPTKVIAKTNGSYGCETSLLIRSARYQAYLPATADTEIDLGTPKSGEKTEGVCGMGMYSFEIKYI